MVRGGTAGSSAFVASISRRRVAMAALGAMLGASVGGLTGQGRVLAGPGGALAGPNVSLVYFPETGHHLQQDFLQFWRTMGGANLFGLPLTEELEWGGRIMQYFEHCRFERLADGGPVELGLLSDELGKAQPRVPPPAGDEGATGRRYYPETVHSVGAGFLQFLDQHGGVPLLGYPVTEELWENDRTVQYFQRFRLEWEPDRPVTAGQLGAEAAARAGVPVDPVARAEQAPDWQEALFPRAPRVASTEAALEAYGPWGMKWIDISISRQLITAYEGDRAVFSDLVSTGRADKGLTPTGIFAIQRRVYNETMDSRTIGIPLSSPRGYLLTNVLYTQYFTGAGHAIHYAWWHNNFGQPMSYGCVNLRLTTARWFWEWAGIGTPVIVHP